MKPKRAVVMLISVAAGLALLLALAGYSQAQAPEPAGQAPSAPEAPASSACGPGPGYHPGCDVDQNSVIDVNDVQRVATKWGQTGVYTADSWLLTGNTGTLPATHFLGTTDNQPLVVRTSDVGRVWITAGGNVGVGTSTPADQLELTGNLALPATTATTGIIKSGGETLIHAYGSSNFFAGIGAGNLSITGTNNTASGAGALSANTGGSHNTAGGALALYRNTMGYNNTAAGVYALSANTTGNNNTASGMNALTANITGTNNTASGVDALRENTWGSSNTASGSGGLRYNTGGHQNTAGGARALYNNETGSSNTASGNRALYLNTTGDNNTASGAYALHQNTGGDGNTAVGVDAGYNSTGSWNTFLGHEAGTNSVTPIDNAVAIGYNAKVNISNAMVLGGTGSNAVNVGIGTSTPADQLELTGNLRLPPTTATTGMIKWGDNTLIHSFGTDNFFAGFNAGNQSMTGHSNTASGAYALRSNADGECNTASGYGALYANTLGGYNTASGLNALSSNTTGGYNTASGLSALAYNTEGYGNTAVGVEAGYYSTGSRNTFIGYGAGPTSTAEIMNATAIGYNATVNTSDTMVLGGTGGFAVKVGIGTSTPQSSLQVTGDYIQFPVRFGEPPGEDCDDASEAGRVVFRMDGPPDLYICTGSFGWITVTRD